MRIALLYPPPKQPPARGRPAGPSADGACDASDASLVPYGLLSLAAWAAEAGHQVKTFNLSTFPWSQVEALLRGLDADLYGLTCLTSNRHGVASAAACIRRCHPAAHIVVGGPHASALPAETLGRWGDVDTVVIGEGEATFAELVERLAAGGAVRGVAGTAWREPDGAVRTGPPRPRIADLDALAKVHAHFPYHVLLTSRGCPGQCSFCASASVWGRRCSFHGVGYVLDSIERMLRRLPFPAIAVKDDTFTAHRRRALEICREIGRRGLRLLWSCDTRADALDEEMLRAMRLAGCQQISLGVESGCPEVLACLRKGVAPEQVLAATRLAQAYGIRVRYFMIAGSRGESVDAFRQSLRLIQAGRPNSYVFSILSVFPGTEEYEILRRQGRIGPEWFFQNDDAEFWHLPPAQVMQELVRRHLHPPIRDFSAAECQAALRRLPDLHAAHVDLGAACFRAGQVDRAELHLLQALKLNYPVPDLVYNYLAGITGRRGDLGGMKAQYDRLVQRPGVHPLVAANAKALDQWLAGGGARSGRKLNLAMRHTFEPAFVASQPVLPAPLPPNACRWPDAPAAAALHGAKAG
jgi:radical SAM superfamily enzyme YgiQ (UPF0313 family)